MIGKTSMSKVFLQIAMASLACWLCVPQLAAMDEWEKVSYLKAGFTSDIGEILDSAAENDELINLHSVVVVRNGKLVTERYYEGIDALWGKWLGTVAFAPDTIHDLRSVTKSIVSLLMELR